MRSHTALDLYFQLLHYRGGQVVVGEKLGFLLMLCEFKYNLKVIPLGLTALELLWNPASISELQWLQAIQCCRPFLGFQSYRGWLIFVYIFKGCATSQTFSFRLIKTRNINSNLTLTKIHMSKRGFSLLDQNHYQNIPGAVCLSANVFPSKDDISLVITLICLPITCVVPKLIWHQVALHLEGYLEVYVGSGHSEFKPINYSNISNGKQYVIKQTCLFIVDYIGFPLKYKTSCNRNTNAIST